MKRHFGPYVFESSREEKVLFPGRKLTKGDLLAHYELVADRMIPQIRDRPLMMRRFPDGIESSGFFQKSVPDHFPDWIRRARVARLGEGDEQELVLCQNAATLAYLADQACIESHVWLSRVDDLSSPDQVIFDLDPATDDFEQVRGAALRLRDLLSELEVVSYIKTSGSRGLHVMIPLTRDDEFDAVREFARQVARVLVDRHDDDLTLEMRKNKRKGRLLVDVARNAYGQTTVAPYAVRALPDAPVATPVTWEEIESGSVHARSFTVESLPGRLDSVPDPWQGMRRRARKLARVREKLRRVVNAR